MQIDFDAHLLTGSIHKRNVAFGLNVTQYKVLEKGLDRIEQISLYLNRELRNPGRTATT